MSKHQKKLDRPLTGQFLGWGDERTPHRSISIATASGVQTLKVAKSLRSQIQDWQLGISLNLTLVQRVKSSSKKVALKVKHAEILPAASPDPSVVMALGGRAASDENRERDDAPTEIRVCQGSSCRRRGSASLCAAMQAYLDDRELTDRVEIVPVKCLHQCKAAPHAIVTHQTEE
jgi:Thioredoxin-like [2Fe-2S] ferredoxin